MATTIAVRVKLAVRLKPDTTGTFDAESVSVVSAFRRTRRHRDLGSVRLQRTWRKIWSS